MGHQNIKLIYTVPNFSHITKKKNKPEVPYFYLLKLAQKDWFGTISLTGLRSEDKKKAYPVLTHQGHASIISKFFTFVNAPQKCI